MNSIGAAARPSLIGSGRSVAAPRLSPARAGQPVLIGIPAPRAAYRERPDWLSLAVVAVLHAASAAFLLTVEPVAHAVVVERPLLVTMLPPVPPQPRVPTGLHDPEPPEPVPAEPGRPMSPMPAVVEAPPSRPPEAPAPAIPTTVAAPATPEPVPVAVAPRTAVPAQPAQAEPTPPLTQPRFDADYLDNPPPAYPALARRLGEQGRVLLRVLVAEDGSAARVELKESSGFERLDRSARDTVRRWRFVPARRGETPVAAWVVVPISFTLRS